MAEQESLQVGRELVEALNAHDVERMVATLDEGVVLESDGYPESPVNGHEGFRQLIQIYFSAFRDLHWESEQEIASGDYVVLRVRGTGTHRGDLGGIAPTNRQVDLHLCENSEAKNGKIVHGWLYFDTGTMLRQMGAAP